MSASAFSQDGRRIRRDEHAGRGRAGKHPGILSLHVGVRAVERAGEAHLRLAEHGADERPPHAASRSRDDDT